MPRRIHYQVYFLPEHLDRLKKIAASQGITCSRALEILVMNHGNGPIVASRGTTMPGRTNAT